MMPFHSFILMRGRFILQFILRFILHSHEGASVLPAHATLPFIRESSSFLPQE